MKPLVHTIVFNRGQNLPNMWMVFAQHVDSICPTCGQYLPNMYRLYLPVLPNIRAVFAQHVGCFCPTEGHYCPTVGQINNNK